MKEITKKEIERRINTAKRLALSSGIKKLRTLGNGGTALRPTISAMEAREILNIVELYANEKKQTPR